MKAFDKNILNIEKKIAYTFRDKSLLRQAFTRTSYINEAFLGKKAQSNEVLEFFGDSVLSSAIVTFLIKEKAERCTYGIYTDLRESEFTSIRSRLSDKSNLSLCIKRIGLQEYLIMGEGDEKLGIANESSVMEDLFESILGAIYIDSDFSMAAVMRSVEAMLDVSEYLLSKPNLTLGSSKSRLQEYCADKKRRLPPPTYKVIKEEGPDHCKSYTVACFIDGKEMSIATARSIKLAEKAAAEKTLAALGEK